MRESIKKRIEAVRRGEVPEGYSMERAMLFPDEWGTPVTLNTVLSENKNRNEDLRFGKEDVLSVSGEQGVVNQIALLGRSYAGESVAPYHVVETGDVVYTKSPLKENPYGIIKQNRGAPGIVSTLYAVYHCSSPITGQYLENYFCIDTFLNNYLKPLVKRGAKNDMKVNNEEVLLGRIPIPPIEEQKKINSLIAQFDRVIDLKQKLIEEKRRQKQWLMQKLLSESSGVNEIKLFTLCSTICDGDWIESKDQSEYGIRLVQTGNVGVGRYLDKEGRARYISQETFDRMHCTEVFPGDVLLSRLPDPIGRACMIPELPTRAITAVDCTILRFKDADEAEFFLQYATSKEYFNKIALLAGGSTRTRISRKEIEKLLIPVPASKTAMQKISKGLSLADQEISALEQELAAWQQKKKALMQLLLTGLVRVNA